MNAAEYVQDALTQSSRDVRGHMVDALKLCYSPFENLVLSAFRFLISRCPNTYRLLYRLTEKKPLFNHVAGLFFTKSIFALKKQCTALQIKAIVCTHPFALLLSSKLKKELGSASPLIMGIITDYQIHRFWLYPQIDLYFVPCEEMKKSLVNLGWNNDKIKVTGVPCPINIKSVMKNIGQKPYWLVSGGGWGLGNIEAATHSLLKRQTDYSLFVVTGENHSLYRRLKALEEKNPGRLIVKGTIPYLYNVMNNALAVLTKPGGLTVTEAMALKKPLILLKPLPGVEEKNLDYLVRRGAAIPYHVFLKHPEIIYHWQEYHSRQQMLTAQSDSSHRIARWILEICTM